MLAALAFLATAHAAPQVTQTLSWDVAIDGKKIGTKTLTIKYATDDAVTVRRLLESYTDVDTTPAGFAYKFRERLTGYAGDGPAAFNATMDENGSPLEVQARRSGTAWKVVVSDYKKEKAFDVSATGIDLSTVDLMDPESRVFLARYTKAKVLVAETGEIWEGPVDSLGQEQVTIQGTPVAANGYRIRPAQGMGSFWYTSDGYLVRFELEVAGHKLDGTMSTAPPQGADEAPVPVNPTAVNEVPL